MATGRLPDPNTAPLTAKGDLYTYSTVPARLAVGSNGDTLVADSSTTTGLRWAADWNTGKNKIINGDFNINQRGFTSTTTTATFGFDRWFMNASDGTSTYSAQTFTPGAAPVAGYEGTNFARIVTTGQTAAGALSLLTQRIEDVRTLANQTVTVSFWAKANTGTPNVTVELSQNYGSGGTANSDLYKSKIGITTSWTRYSVTLVLNSISGKTIGTGSNLQLAFWVSAGTNFNTRTDSLGIQSNTFDFWGVQVEAGSVATPFTTATGTLAGELAACQRYYEQTFVTAATESANKVSAYSDANYTQGTRWKVTKRATPTVTLFSSNGGTANRIRQISNNTNYTPGSVADIGVDGFNIVTGVGQSNMMDFHYTASAEL